MHEQKGEMQERTPEAQVGSGLEDSELEDFELEDFELRDPQQDPRAAGLEHKVEEQQQEQTAEERAGPDQEEKAGEQGQKAQGQLLRAWVQSGSLLMGSEQGGFAQEHRAWLPVGSVPEVLAVKSQAQFDSELAHSEQDSSQ